LRALGDVFTASIGLAAMLQVWTVFPFDFGDTTVPWDLLTRMLIVIAIAGSAIAILVQAIVFVRELIRTQRGETP
jgi:hypothetical protein